jgi:DNA-binding transcriptional ArsR family regulator
MEIEPRQRIYRAVREAPGVHFRELQRLLGEMPTGQLEYHLNALCEQGLIQAKDDRYYKRYYASEIDARDKELMAVLRQENPRKIVMHVMLNPGIGHGELASSMGMAPSTVSFYLGDMVEKGVLRREKEGRTSSYTVLEPDRVSRVLVTYRQGFLDKLVDRFISVWFAKEAAKQQPEKDVDFKGEKKLGENEEMRVQDSSKDAEPPSSGEEKPNTNKEVPKR